MRDAGWHFGVLPGRQQVAEFLIKCLNNEWYEWASVASSIIPSSCMNLLSFDVNLEDFFSSYQPNAHFLYSVTIYMLHYNPQHVSSSNLLVFRRTNYIITASGIVTLGRTVCRLRADCSPLSTGILYGCLQRVTIPGAVVIQFVLLKMSNVLFETCWGLLCNIYEGWNFNSGNYLFTTDTK